jgi:transglutaminase-like putative cysteine protease
MSMSPVAMLEVEHETVYAYAEPVAQSHHVAHLRPLSDPTQNLIEAELSISPQPDSARESLDSFGNTCLHFALSRPHQQLRVLARSRVALAERYLQLDTASSPPWEQLRDRLRYVARAPFDPAVEFVQPSPFVPRLEVLRAYGTSDFWPGRPVAQGAVALMGRIHQEFEYRGQSTDVDTPVAEAFALRRGVCQDFAHVMIGVCRMLGLPARYVSGYLLTRAAGGGPALVGADASHAWVQVYAPGTVGVPADGWLDLDPTNNLVPGTEHVRLATGRDFGDVTPLRGVIRGGGSHTLSVGVTTRLLPSGAAAGPVVAK